MEPQIPGTKNEKKYKLHEYEKHFALQRRDLGPCRKMLGKIAVILAFVDTKEHPWTDEKIAEVMKVSKSSVRIMKEEAKKYGVELELSLPKLRFGIPMEHDPENKKEFYQYILNKYYKVSNMSIIQQRYRFSLEVDSAPMIFLFNSDGESYTWVKRADLSGDGNDEYCVIFCDKRMHDNYLTHELLHQYGAIDLYDYKHEGVQDAARKYLGESCMMKEVHRVDELTAFLIGWIDEVSKNVVEFLDTVEGLR